MEESASRMMQERDHARPFRAFEVADRRLRAARDELDAANRAMAEAVEGLRPLGYGVHPERKTLRPVEEILPQSLRAEAR